MQFGAFHLVEVRRAQSRSRPPLFSCTKVLILGVIPEVFNTLADGPSLTCQVWGEQFVPVMADNNNA